MTTGRPPIPKKRRVILAVRLTADEARNVKACAVIKRITMTQLVRDALSDCLSVKQGS